MAAFIGAYVSATEPKLIGEQITYDRFADFQCRFTRKATAKTNGLEIWLCKVTKNNVNGRSKECLSKETARDEAIIDWKRKSTIKK